MESLFVILVIFSIPSAIIAAVWGDARQIGWGWSFVACMLTTPLIGLIITLMSETKVKYNDRQKALYLQQQQLDALKNASKPSSADDLQKLISMRDSGAITEEEFQKMKSKIIG